MDLFTITYRPFFINYIGLEDLLLFYSLCKKATRSPIYSNYIINKYPDVEYFHNLNTIHILRLLYSIEKNYLYEHYKKFSRDVCSNIIINSHDLINLYTSFNLKTYTNSMYDLSDYMSNNQVPDKYTLSIVGKYIVIPLNTITEVRLNMYRYSIYNINHIIALTVTFIKNLLYYYGVEYHRSKIANVLIDLFPIYIPFNSIYYLSKRLINNTKTIVARSYAKIVVKQEQKYYVDLVKHLIFVYKISNIDYDNIVRDLYCITPRRRKKMLQSFTSILGRSGGSCSKMIKLISREYKDDTLIKTLNICSIFLSCHNN